MTVEEYFGDWMDVIDRDELVKISAWLKTQNPNILCPAHKDVFKAFRMCSLADCKVIMVGQDPFPQKGVATGILFGNKPNTTNISPSLEVIKRAAMNGNNGIFDITMESWAKQGVLMINSALTCEVNNIGSHYDKWKPFIYKLIRNISRKRSDIIFVLFGSQAQILKKVIAGQQPILEAKHPAYFARFGRPMPSDVFIQMNELLGENKINLYENI